MKPTKEQMIDSLLKNSVYLPESRLIENLKTALSKLSYSNINNLLLIVELKLQDARESKETR